MCPKNVSQKICSYEKFGFCMKREQCENIHPTENCNDVNCSIVDCRKRHPQPCIFFGTQNGCRFGRACKFDHQKQMYFQSKLEEMQAEIVTLKEQMKLLVTENKDKHEVIKMLLEGLKAVQNKDCKNCENKNIVAEDISMHERSKEDYENELNVYKKSFYELKDLRLKLKDKPIMQTVASFQKFKDNFHEKIKPWIETDDYDYRGLKETIEEFEEIYNKLTKASTNKKQFKKIASEQINIVMLEIDRMHTTVGSVREGDYDIELEELDFKSIEH